MKISSMFPENTSIDNEYNMSTYLEVVLDLQLDGSMDGSRFGIKFVARVSEFG